MPDNKNTDSFNTLQKYGNNLKYQVTISAQYLTISVIQRLFSDFAG